MTSTNEDPPTSIIKSDAVGRPRYSHEYRKEVLSAYAESGMSGPAFAKHCGIKYPTFISWVAAQKRLGAENLAKNGEQKFLIAEIATDTGSSTGLPIALPGGASANLTSISQAPLVAALIKALG